MSIGTSAEKAITEAVEGKAAKSSSRSYMGQLHSALAETGENLGMSKKAASVVSGIGMAGVGIGAFGLANSSSENHPFLGGAMKVGIVAGAGYAALKGHGAKAIGEAAEATEAATSKKLVKAGKDAAGSVAVGDTVGSGANRFVGPDGFLSGKGGGAPPGVSAAGSKTQFLGGYKGRMSSVGGAGNNAAGAVSTGGGVASAAAAVEKTAVPSAAGTVAATAPAMSVAEASKEATSGTVSTNAGLHSTQPSSSVDAGTNSVSGRIGKSVGAGAVNVSGENVSPVKRNHDAERRAAREMAKGKKVN